MTALGYQLKCVVVDNGDEREDKVEQSNTASDGNDASQQRPPRLLLPHQYANTSLLSYSTQWKNHQYYQQHQHEQKVSYSDDSHNNYSTKKRKTRSTSSTTPIVVFGITSYNDNRHDKNEKYLMACTSQGQIMIWDINHYPDDGTTGSQGTTTVGATTTRNTHPQPQTVRPWSMIVDVDDDEEEEEDANDNTHNRADTLIEQQQSISSALLTTSNRNERMNRPLLRLQLHYCSHDTKDHPNIVLYHCYMTTTTTHLRNHSHFIVCGDHGTLMFPCLFVCSFVFGCLHMIV
jgi:hypothetical protein